MKNQKYLFSYEFETGWTCGGKAEAVQVPGWALEYPPVKYAIDRNKKQGFALWTDEETRETYVFNYSAFGWFFHVVTAQAVPVRGKCRYEVCADIVSFVNFYNRSMIRGTAYFLQNPCLLAMTNEQGKKTVLDCDRVGREVYDKPATADKKAKSNDEQTDPV